MTTILELGKNVPLKCANWQCWNCHSILRTELTDDLICRKSGDVRVECPNCGEDMEIPGESFLPPPKPKIAPPARFLRRIFNRA